MRECRWMPLELLEGWRGWLFVENEQPARGWIPATVAV